MWNNTRDTGPPQQEPVELLSMTTTSKPYLIIQMCDGI
jgi:hypothetical protein